MASGSSSQYRSMSGSLQNDMKSSNYLLEQRLDDNSQDRDGARYGIPQNENSGYNIAASAPRYQQPVYSRVPSYTAHEQYGSRQYGPSGRKDGTSNSRAEMASFGNGPVLYTSNMGNGSSTSRTQEGNGRHHPSETPQPSRQQNKYGPNTSYGSPYKNKYNSHTNTIAGYQQSPYLLPGQEPHDVNNPPSAFRPGTAAVMHRNTTAVPPARKVKTKQLNDPIESSKEAEEPIQESESGTTKKMRNPPRTKCETLRKVIHKHGETKTVNGQVMWLDPNEPAHKKWSK